MDGRQFRNILHSETEYIYHDMKTGTMVNTLQVNTLFKIGRIYKKRCSVFLFFSTLLYALLTGHVILHQHCSEERKYICYKCSQLGQSLPRSITPQSEFPFHLSLPSKCINGYQHLLCQWENFLSAQRLDTQVFW